MGLAATGIKMPPTTINVPSWETDGDMEVIEIPSGVRAPYTKLPSAINYVSN